MQQAAPGPDQLKSPEPNFFVLGAKSYGRDSSFLLRTGHAQVETVVGLLRESLLGESPLVPSEAAATRQAEQAAEEAVEEYASEAAEEEAPATAEEDGAAVEAASEVQDAVDADLMQEEESSLSQPPA